MTGLRFDHYDWPGGREAMLRFGPDTGAVVVAALPLFEEANRTRAFTVAILRALDCRGVASVLPDLPGTGDSLLTTADATIGAMRAAYAALVAALRRDDCPVYAVGIRSGALLDADATLDGRWHLAPQTGPDVLRELHRIRDVGKRSASASIAAGEFAGNSLSDDMLADLLHVTPVVGNAAASRTVRLESDPREADHKLPGAPLWRRTEPDTDAALAVALAGDISRWIASCAG